MITVPSLSLSLTTTNLGSITSVIVAPVISELLVTSLWISLNIALSDAASFASFAHPLEAIPGYVFPLYVPPAKKVFDFSSRSKPIVYTV